MRSFPVLLASFILGELLQECENKFSVESMLTFWYNSHYILSLDCVHKMIQILLLGTFIKTGWYSYQKYLIIRRVRKNWYIFHIKFTAWSDKVGKKDDW